MGKLNLCLIYTEIFMLTKFHISSWICSRSGKRRPTCTLVVIYMVYLDCTPEAVDEWNSGLGQRHTNGGKVFNLVRWKAGEGNL